MKTLTFLLLTAGLYSQECCTPAVAESAMGKCTGSAYCTVRTTAQGQS